MSNLCNSKQLDAFYGVGRLLYDRGDYARAADVFRFVALVAPERADTWWALGACHEQTDQLELAAELYDLGYRIDADATDLGLLAARAHARSGGQARAREILRELAPLALDSSRLSNVRSLVAELEGGAP